MTIDRHPNGHWTLERCKAEAQRFTSRTAWSKNSVSAYESARLHEWLDECCAHMISTNHQKNYWTLQRCIEDAQRFRTRGQWRVMSNSAYTKAQRKGWGRSVLSTHERDRHRLTVRAKVLVLSGNLGQRTTRIPILSNLSRHHDNVRFRTDGLSLNPLRAGKIPLCGSRIRCYPNLPVKIIFTI